MLNCFPIPAHIEIKKTKKGKGVFTKIPFKKGDTVLKFERPILRPNRQAKATAIQLDYDLYLDTDPIEVRDFLNHECSPNCKIDVTKLELVAVKEIDEGEEITFNYCTTEFDLLAKNESFTCLCDSAECLGVINGFYHLTSEQKTKIKDLLIPYLLEKYYETVRVP